MNDPDNVYLNYFRQLIVIFAISNQKQRYKMSGVENAILYTHIDLKTTT